MSSHSPRLDRRWAFAAKTPLLNFVEGSGSIRTSIYRWSKEILEAGKTGWLATRREARPFSPGFLPGSASSTTVVFRLIWSWRAI